MKKGFMFYVGFLLLVVFGAALVMLVVLLCSPGTEILGFKYFSYGETKEWLTTTDDSATPLNLGIAEKYSEIQIEAGYAEVKVEKSTSYDQDSIVIVNNAKGFVMTQHEVKYDYSILVEEGVLKVKMTEPSSFLSFSRDVKVIVQIADKNANPFASTKFTVKTDSGNITLGGLADAPHYYDFNVGAIDFKTNSGAVKITNVVNYDKESKTQSFSSVSLNVGGGSFKAHSQNFEAQGDMILQSTSGKFEMTNAEADNIYVKTESGTYEMTNLTADATNVECKNGYFYIDSIVGNVKFPSADMNIESPILKSKMIGGNLQIISGNNIKVEVDNVFGNADVTTTSGSVMIGSGKNSGIGGTANIKTQSGKILVYVKDGNSLRS